MLKIHTQNKNNLEINLNGGLTFKKFRHLSRKQLKLQLNRSHKHSG